MGGCTSKDATATREAKDIPPESKIEEVHVADNIVSSSQTQFLANVMGERESASKEEADHIKVSTVTSSRTTVVQR
jgi:hypothetical protein